LLFIHFIQEPPGTPRNLQVSDITTDSVSLSWEPPESDGTCDVVQYSIDMREDHQNEFISLAKLSSYLTSYTAEYLQTGRLYRFRVRAKNAAGFCEKAAELENPVQVKIPLSTNPYILF
jgi:titin